MSKISPFQNNQFEIKQLKENKHGIYYDGCKLLMCDVAHSRVVTVCDI